MEKLIVTTSLGMATSLVTQAQALAKTLHVPYQARQKRSLKQLLALADQVLVVYQDQLRLAQADGRTLVFHPDTAMLRIKSPRDPLIDLLGAAPKTVLDATMGLASDSLVMSYAGHAVTALESQPLIHFMVSQGLQTFRTGQADIDAAMRRIVTVQTEALAYLTQQPDQSVDVIYFDPMFSEAIAESQNLSGLERLANPDRFSLEMLAQAKRVAREAIIIKAYFRDTVFEDFGFERQVRPNQKFHFGIIRLGDI